ncbi:MAG: SMC-Scp complex subunit ScpB [Chitinispirillales bacterium]|jgi:segregation and condensation protein B|nr:SMC-Scp complex subunit ScpB [Chitinispirillales bacterium]
MENLDNTEQNEVTFDDDSGVEEQQQEEKVDELKILEALLFASEELLTPAKLRSMIPGGPDARRIRKMVNEINSELEKQKHPFEIIETAGGYQFRTLAVYYPWVRKLYKERAAKKLSLPALECLAIIAYRQPISKADVEVVRGVMSDGAMKTLLEKKLVNISGRSDKPGRPLLYSTTSEFLKYFGINKINDLPRIEEFEALAREKMELLSTEELSSQDANNEIDQVLEQEQVQAIEQDFGAGHELEQTQTPEHRDCEADIADKQGELNE